MESGQRSRYYKQKTYSHSLALRDILITEYLLQGTNNTLCAYTKYTVGYGQSQWSTDQQGQSIVLCSLTESRGACKYSCNAMNLILQN
jgi:hypothetical protein